MLISPCIIFHPLLQPIIAPAALSAADLERLERVERQLGLLWEQVKQADQKQDQRHGDILVIYNTLREQLHTQTDKERMGLWVSSLLEQRLKVLQGELEQENTQRAQVRDQDKCYKMDRSSRIWFTRVSLFCSICVTMQSEEQQKQHQESQTTRLADLELLLKALATKTEVCKDGALLSLRRHLENM